MIDVEPKLNQKQILDIVGLLKKLEPGFLPYPIFTQIARLTTLTTIELVALLDRQGSNIEVLLLQRPENDDFWPGMWHVPGSVLRPTDTKGSYIEALNRIIAGELGNTPMFVPPTFLKNHFRQEARGAMHAIVHWSLLKDIPLVGQLFHVDALPEKIVPEHVETIILATKAYLSL